MQKIGLKFLDNPDDEGEGLNHGGIETFREKPFGAVARETGQNSRDARLDDTTTVKLSFDIIEIPANDFPNIADYRTSVEFCLKEAKQKGDQKEISFFENAKSRLKGDQISVLRIEDFNTHGAKGPCVKGTPFYTLAKTEGGSVKLDEHSGGSFGLGKNAVFAISDLHTAFFSTRYKNADGEEKTLCIGKSLLISHDDDEGNKFRSKAYWGLIGTGPTQPVEMEVQMPTWLRRDEIGTSIYSVLPRTGDVDWQDQMVCAILINFFAAIHEGNLEFELDDGSIAINEKSLATYFADSKYSEAAKNLDWKEEFETSSRLLRCISDPKSTSQIISIDGLGKFELRMLLREGEGYNFGIVRNGMFITDNLSNFGDKFERFRMHQEFAAILRPYGKEESALLKTLENPKHDSLSADNIIDSILGNKIRENMRKLILEVRKSISEFAKSKPKDQEALDELSDLFASEGEREIDDLSGELDPLVSNPTVISTKKRNTKTKNTPDPTGEQHEDIEPTDDFGNLGAVFMDYA